MDGTHDRVPCRPPPLVLVEEWALPTDLPESTRTLKECLSDLAPLSVRGPRLEASGENDDARPSRKLHDWLQQECEDSESECGVPILEYVKS